MIDFLSILVIAGLILQAVVGLSFLVSSIFEKEKRAAIFGGVQFGGMLFLLLLFSYLYGSGTFDTGPGMILPLLAFLTGVCLVIVLSRRTAANPNALKGTRGYIRGHVKRFDERDQVFARNRSLPEGSEQYKAYYQAHPELEEIDRNRRKAGGPIGRPGTIDHPNADANVAAGFASLSMPHFLSKKEFYEPEPHTALKEKRDQGSVVMSPEEATARVKGYATALGASLVGITKINPLWVYSHRGEIFNDSWEDWGSAIETKHPYAIVCAEEMHLDMVCSAPHTPTYIESMMNYSKGAIITTQLAGYIANLGYSATANHFRHYDTLLVPMAVDAGLGEVGRNGYVITRKFGPRIRLSLVTTDLELVPDTPVDIGVEDFCRMCKKCADCCPSNSIPKDEMKEVNGTLRWKLSEQSCFEYWGRTGTDCNICMNVCPWSHADTLPHQLIKMLITRNHLSRRLFNLMDDVFYGKQPKPKPPARWAWFKPWESR